MPPVIPQHATARPLETTPVHEGGTRAGCGAATSSAYLGDAVVTHSAGGAVAAGSDAHKCPAGAVYPTVVLAAARAAAVAHATPPSVTALAAVRAALAAAAAAPPPPSRSPARSLGAAPVGPPSPVTSLAAARAALAAAPAGPPPPATALAAARAALNAAAPPSPPPGALTAPPSPPPGALTAAPPTAAPSRIPRCFQSTSSKDRGSSRDGLRKAGITSAGVSEQTEGVVGVDGCDIQEEVADHEEL
eukprot:GHVQ01005355.1.p1 GENE.GHVQ01005355.1~~GHVQ01005355.1.p1  ORF type:complete len:280 (+),score=82.58 GHVQ01005355.1:101-841(+)